MAATLTRGGELTFLSFPIEKTETLPNGDVIVYGKATDGSLDSDEQIIDPEFAAKAIQDWLSDGANIRVQHNPQRDPAGVGLEADTDGTGATWVKGRIVEPVAQKLVNAGALRAYSVGIARPKIERDPVARGGRITGGQVVEISLVDRPANKNCSIQLVKAAKNGSPEYSGVLTGDDTFIAKYAGAPVAAREDDMTITATETAEKMVTLELPEDVTVAFSPVDLARIVAKKKSSNVGEDRVEGGVDRDDMPGEDFAGKDRSFPIHSPGDVSDAALSIGRAGDANYGSETLKQNIKAIARRKGPAFEAQLPDSWREEEAAEKLEAASYLIMKYGWSPEQLEKMSTGAVIDLMAAVKSAEEADVTKGACDLCHGTGKIREGNVTCPRCHGKGSLASESSDDDEDGAVEKADHSGDEHDHGHDDGDGSDAEDADDGDEDFGDDDDDNTDDDESVEKPAGADVTKDWTAWNNAHRGLTQPGQRVAPPEPVRQPEPGTKTPPSLRPRRPEHPGAKPAAKPKPKKQSTYQAAHDALAEQHAGKKINEQQQEAIREAHAAHEAHEAHLAHMRHMKAVSKGEKMACKCGAMVKAKHKFCPACGKPVGSMGEVPEKTGVKKSAVPGDSVTGVNDVKPVPPHREPDGAEVEAWEEDAGMQDDGDENSAVEQPTHLEEPTLKGDLDVLAMARLVKSSAPVSLGVLHDLTCPAFSAASLAKSYPGRDFSNAIDEREWQQKALDLAAILPFPAASHAAQLGQHAMALKAATEDEVAEARAELYKAFSDANPAPGTAPTPGQVKPGQFNRPYISDGHAAPSPAAGAPNQSPLVSGEVTAAQFQRGPLIEGHAAPSPGDGPSLSQAVGSALDAAVMAQAMSGAASLSKGRTFYSNRGKAATRTAMQAIHDHISQTFPDLCPMHGEAAPSKPDAAPESVKMPSVPRVLTKADSTGASASGSGNKAKAKKARRAAIIKELLEAEAELAESSLPAGSIEKAAAEVTEKSELKQLLTEQAGQLATMQGIISSQGKLLKKQAKALDELAGQPDPAVMPYRGIALQAPEVTKSSHSAVPGGTMADVAERTKAMMLSELETQFRTSPDPSLREAAWRSILQLRGVG